MSKRTERPVKRYTPAEVDDVIDTLTRFGHKVASDMLTKARRLITDRPIALSIGDTVLHLNGEHQGKITLVTHAILSPAGYIHYGTTESLWHRRSELEFLKPATRHTLAAASRSLTAVSFSLPKEEVIDLADQ